MTFLAKPRKAEQSLEFIEVLEVGGREGFCAHFAG
jgi:hypothetical protein